MREPFRLLHNCTAVLTDAVLLQLIILTASLGGSRGQVLFLFPVWLAAGLVCTAVNRVLLLRGIPVPALAAVNAALFAAALALLFTTAQTLEGPLGYLLGIGLPVISQGRAIYHAWASPRLQTQITRLDGALACTAWAFLLSAGNISAGGLTLWLPVLIALNVICAVALRVSAGDEEGALLLRAPVRGMLFAGGTAAVLILLVLLLTHFLGGGSKSAVSGFFRAVTAAWLTLWHGIESFFRWLVSLFPNQGPAELPLPTAETAGSVWAPDTASQSMFPLLPVLAAILAAAAAGALIVLIVRLRRVRLHLESHTTPGQRSERAVRSRRTGSLARRWNALLAAVRFRLLAFRHRSTPAGLLVWLEHWGKRHKQPRGGGETIRAYLLRLDGGASLLPLADVLDAQYYGPGGTLTARQCRRIRRDFLRCRRRQRPPQATLGGGV